MASPYVGEIRCFGFNFAPQGWAFCNGQLVPIAENDALFAILGTTYGGDGIDTFGLPNLQGRIPMHWGNGPGGFNTTIGETLGAPTETLSINEIPTHTHSLVNAVVPTGGVVDRIQSPTAASFIADSSPDQVYKAVPSFFGLMSPNTIGPTGGSQPHDNMQPYLALNFCISLFGIFPSRN